MASEIGWLNAVKTLLSEAAERMGPAVAAPSQFDEGPARDRLNEDRQPHFAPAAGGVDADPRGMRSGSGDAWRTASSHEDAGDVHNARGSLAGLLGSGA